MTLQEFHNGLRLLRSIDSSEIGDPDWWPAFRDDPYMFFIRCAEEDAERIWAAMVKRMPRGPETELRAALDCLLHAGVLRLGK